MTVRLRINGRLVELAEPIPLIDYLAGLKVDPRAVAVEVNGHILERSEFAGTMLAGGDSVEIVRMVGGGSSGPFQPTSRAAL